MKKTTCFKTHSPVFHSQKPTKNVSYSFIKRTITEIVWTFIVISLVVLPILSEKISTIAQAQSPAVSENPSTEKSAAAPLSEGFEKDVQRYEAESLKNKPTSDTTFFVGSSTFTLWKTIPSDFNEFQAINRGFGGSQISDWFNAGPRLIIPYQPKRIVFFCGVNDVASGKTPQKAVENFKKLLQLFRADNPTMQVYFCSLTHAPVRKQFWDKYDEVNQAVQEMSKSDPNLFYIDFVQPLNDKNGQTNESFFLEDRLHLNRSGQEILIPLIRQALKAQENTEKDRATEKRVGAQ